MNLHENKKLFAESVLAAAKYLGINAVYIEKDYWIMRTLFQMKKYKFSPNANNLKNILDEENK